VSQTTVSTDIDQAAWDAYINTHPEATRYHLWAWRGVFERAFRHETIYLAARRDTCIVGVLPLVSFRSLLFGRFLVSLPFVNYGGVLADDEGPRPPCSNEPGKKRSVGWPRTSSCVTRGAYSRTCRQGSTRWR